MNELELIREETEKIKQQLKAMLQTLQDKGHIKIQMDEHGMAAIDENGKILEKE